MLITASWGGVADVAVEVDEACRSVAALRCTLAAAVPQVDAEEVCLEIGGCAADDEAVCSLCEGSVVTVLPRSARGVAALIKERRVVDLGGFCRAAAQGDMRLCELYLDAEVHRAAPERHRVTYRDTPLHVACCNGNLPLCTLLIERGHPLDIHRTRGQAPLHCAVRASVGDEITNGGVLPFIKPPRATSVEVCRLLIDGGCSLDVRDERGCTPLHEAARANCVETCALLIDSGSSLEARDAGNRTPLHCAVTSDPYFQTSVGLSRLLIAKGSPLDLQDRSGRTPLHCAVVGCGYCAHSIEVCTLLIDGGCRLDVRDRAGYTPLQVAVTQEPLTPSSSAELCQLLLAKGCSFDVQNGADQTPRQEAVKDHSVKLCKLLIDSGAVTDLTIAQRRSLFYIASSTGDTAMHKLLTDHGVSDPRSKPRPPRRSCLCCLV